MIYFCCDERRRALVRDHGLVDGKSTTTASIFWRSIPKQWTRVRQHRLPLHFQTAKRKR
jgi:hypothetical protein